MKKLFLTVCFIFAFAIYNQGFAAVTTIDEATIESRQPKPIDIQNVTGLPDANDVNAVRAFLKERFQSASVSDASDLGDLNKSNAIDLQHSAEYLESLQESKKSTFEKIYDQLMGHLDEPQTFFSPDTVFYEMVKETSNGNTKDVPNIAVVSVRLPNGKVVLAPAREHIAYLLASYHILPTGSVEVEEDITLVANAQTLQNGLVKKLKKWTTSREGVKKKLDITLLSVTLNGQELDYKLTEIGNDIVISPRQAHVLAPGVYNYRLRYLLDRKLWYYKDFTEFHANVTSGFENLVITSANAIVSVPDGKTFISQTAMTGFKKNLSSKNVAVALLDKNALGFATYNPLHAGESMHILVGLDNSVFITPSFGRRFFWFITDYGDIFFALLGLLAVFLSYFMSWNGIQKNKTKPVFKLKQSAPLNRCILENAYDKRSFASALLELYRKKIIDIKKEGQSLLLIKRTDNLKNLSNGLKKVVRLLFGKNDSVLEMSQKNALKFSRAQKYHAKKTKRTVQFLRWRLGLSYLFFGALMFLITLFAIAYIAINPLEVMLILLIGSLTGAFYLWVMEHSFSNKYVKYVAKSISALFVVSTILFLSIYIHFLSALFLSATLWLIIKYAALFANKGGLIQTKINALENLKKYLKTNAADISQSVEFDIQQANIFALNLEDLYPSNPKIAQRYRLDLAKEMLNILKTF